MKKPLDYEENARRRIWQWKNPEQSWFDKAMVIVSWPLDKTVEAVLNTSGLGPAVQKALAGSLGVIDDISQ